MTYDLKFQLLASDVATIQSATIGRNFRLLSKLAYAFMLVFNVYLLSTESASLLNWGLVALSTILLFDITLLYRPYFFLRDSNATIQINDQNLSSSLGEKRYEIPWQYFASRGTVVENTDHFYLNCKLGKIFLPKRAFQDEAHLQQFRDDISRAVGGRYERGQLEIAG